jgi:hypothetical protein
MLVRRYHNRAWGAVAVVQVHFLARDLLRRGF